MIKSMSGDSHLLVSAGGPGPWFSPTTSAAGTLRYNPTNYNVEVYDGNGWQMLSQHVTINLSVQASDAIAWCTKKMEQERRIKEYADKYPAVSEALRHVQQSQEVLDSVVSLVKDY